MVPSQLFAIYHPGWLPQPVQRIRRLDAASIQFPPPTPIQNTTPSICNYLPISTDTLAHGAGVRTSASTVGAAAADGDAPGRHDCAAPVDRLQRRGINMHGGVTRKER